ncbi:uncharacterized protein EAF01_006166 [Botrytis porri]|uniref:Crh-like protein n=1 Tax=Botrytis porri TaxID=87229 RepID=A0A4Z1KZA4_9HELO|nr:uncharacterized protein EAF01_006166 [Botrytis porri]KAF7905645.1 hypothetical protein EAF01_006166 [Botrytis porri]TGO89892.1 hypothetical protein BPOR_0088g00020 [Botrytis porri]
MRSSTISASAVVLLSGLASAQTFTDCNPTTKSCPADPAIGGLQVTDFTAGKSSNWEVEEGTTMTYDGTLGAQFVISTATNAPTIKNIGYIMFGRIETWVRASAGTGIVSSFILESDDLDEIDWEWLGSNNAAAENNFFGKGNTTTYDRAQYPAVATPIDTFHNYTIDWTAESTVWYIDGVAVRTLLYNDAQTLGGKNYPQTPMLVKMGSWIGCASEAAVTDPATAGTCSWAGGAVDLTKGPFTMYVKNVTIQDYGCATEYTYGDMTGDYKSIKTTGGCSANGLSSLASSSGSSSSSSSASGSSSSTATKSSSGSSSLSTVTGTSSGIAVGTATGTATLSAGVKATAAAVSGSTTGSSTLAQVTTTSDANSLKKPKHEYGMLDLGVMVLGLGLGYLVM